MKTSNKCNKCSRNCDIELVVKPQLRRYCQALCVYTGKMESPAELWQSLEAHLMPFERVFVMCLLSHKRNKAPIDVHRLSTITYQAVVCERLQLASVLTFILGAVAEIDPLHRSLGGAKEISWTKFPDPSILYKLSLSRESSCVYTQYVYCQQEATWLCVQFKNKMCVYMG